jgi:release factor glutamine methyltransferase
VEQSPLPWLWSCHRQYVTASDISSDALAVANQNAQELNASVAFVESDLFTHVEGQYDAIISNPPYIDPDEEVMEMGKVL